MEPVVEAAEAEPLVLASPADGELSDAYGRDLHRSANRRVAFGVIFTTTAAVSGLGTMALWSPDLRTWGGAIVSEGQAAAGLVLLASGVQMQRRAQLALGAEPPPNGFYMVGLALGGGALIAGALTPTALATEDRPFIYATTGTAGALGAGATTLLVIANVVELRRTAPLAKASRGAIQVQPSLTGVTGTW